MSVSGRWLELRLPWHETNVANCPVCGKLITSRAWEFSTARGRLQVCEPECEQLYDSYYRGAHGPLPP
jgi:hypothetical protein